MNSSDGALDFDAVIRNTDFNAAIQDMQRRIIGLTDKVESETKRMDSAFSKVGGAIGAYLTFDFASQFVGDMATMTGEVQKFKAVLSNSLGSDELADSAMAMLQNFAATTPFQLNEVTGAYVKLVNQGFKPTEAQMTKLGDLASSTGKGIDQLAEAVIDAQTGEFERLKEFGIKASKQGDQVTFSFKGVQTQVENTNDAIQNYIVGLGALNGVAGSNAKISETLTGEISNLKDKWEQAMVSMGKNSSGLLSGGIEVAGDLIDHYQDIIDTVKVLVATYGTYKAILIASVAIQKASVLATQIQEYFAIGKALGFATANQLAFNKAALANPYALIAAGIALVISSLYIYSKRQKEATQEISLHVKTQAEFAAKLKDEQSEMDKLVAIAKNEKASREDRRVALDKLKESAGGYLDKLTLENIGHKDGAELLRKYNDQLERKYRIEANESEIKTLYGTLRTLNKGIELSQTMYENTKKRLSKDQGEVGGQTLMTMKNNLDGLKEKAIQTRAQIDGLLKDNVDASTPTKKTETPVDKKAAEKAKKELEDKLKAQKSLREAIVDNELSLEAERVAIMKDGYNKRKAQAEFEYKQKIESLNKEQSELIAKAKEAKKPVDGDALGVILQRKDVAKKDMDLKISDANKDAAKGLEEVYKTLSDVFLTEEDRKAEGVKERYQKMREWAKEAQEKGDVSKDEKVKFDVKINESEVQEEISGLLEKYKTMTAQRLEIENKYDRDIKKLRADGKNAQADEGEKQKKKALKEFDSQLIEEYSKSSGFFTSIYAKASDMSKKSLTTSIASIKKLIAYIQGEGKELPEGITAEIADKMKQFPEELGSLYEQLNNLQTEYNEKNKYPFSDVINGLDEVRKSGELSKKAMSENNKETRKILEKQAEVAKSNGMAHIANGAVEAAGAVQMVADKFNELAEASGSNSMKEAAAQFSAFSSLTSATAQGFASGGPWGAVASGATNILGQTAEAFIQEKAEEQELLQSRTDFLNQLQLMELKVKDSDYETVFGVSAIGKAAEGYIKAQDALKSYNDTVNKKMEAPGKTKEYENAGAVIYGGFLGGTRKRLTNEYKTLLDAYKKGYTELQGMAVKTKDRSGWSNFWGSKDQYKALKDYAPELWGSDGVFSVEKATAFLAADKKVNDEQRKKIQNVIDLKAAYDENMEIVRKDIADTFGVLGDAITDSIVDSIMNGADAWQEFTKAGSESLEKLGKKLMYELFFSKKFNDLQEQLKDTYDLGDSGAVADAQMKLLSDFFSNIKTDMANAQAWGEEWKKKAADAGFDIWDSTNASGLSGAIKGMSQQSADLIAGQFNSMNVSLFDLTGIARDQVRYLSEIASNTSYNVHLKEIRDILKSGSGSSSDPLRAKGF